MANVFIIWDDMELALNVRSEVSKAFPDERFIVGGQSNCSLSITDDILAEMESSDFAICLISRVPLSENLLYELGYLTARLQDSYRLLVFLVNQSHASLPFDIKVNRAFAVKTHLDPKPLYDLICREYKNSKERALRECGERYIAIFNNWPNTKCQLSNLRRGVLNSERIHDCVAHSIISAYFYGQNEQQDLLAFCRQLPEQMKAAKDVVELVAEHYNIGASLVSRFPLKLSEKENIWLRFFSALYNGLQAVTLVDRELTDKEDYKALLKLSIESLGKADTILDEIEKIYFCEWNTPNFYTSLLRGFVYNNFAAAYWAMERLNLGDMDVQPYLERSIKCREIALKSYDALAQTDKSGVILDALQWEYCWGIRKEIQYLEEMKGIDCKRKRAALNKRIEKMNQQKLIQRFWDKLYN